jgi:hypothetical protein
LSRQETSEGLEDLIEVKPILQNVDSIVQYLTLRESRYEVQKSCFPEEGNRVVREKASEMRDPMRVTALHIA